MFLIDIIAEFANVRVAGGRYSSKLGNLSKQGNKKIFAFTNKQYRKAYYDPDTIGKAIGFRNNPIGANIERQWLLPHDVEKIMKADDPNVNLKTIKKAINVDRMGRIKTAIQLSKIKRNKYGKFPIGKTTTLSRYINVDKKDIDRFLDNHSNKTNRNINTPYYQIKNNELRFKNNSSSSIDSDGDDFYGGVGRSDPNDVRIQYMIKPKKKNSQGRFVSHYSPDSEEQSEVLFPYTTRYRLKHIKKTPTHLRTDKKMDQYNIRLDEI